MKRFIKDRQHTSTEMKTKLTCWYCGLHDNNYNRNILDEYGCCKRCGTNITKYPKRSDKPYPRQLLSSKKGDEALSTEVLGRREKFTNSDGDGQNDW